MKSRITEQDSMEEETFFKESESSDEQTQSYIEQKKMVFKNYNEGEGNTTPQNDTEKENYEDYSKEREEKEEKNKEKWINIRVILNVIYVIVGVSSFEFAMQFNRPQYELFKAEGRDKPIFQTLNFISLLGGLIFVKNVFEREGLKKSFFVTGILYTVVCGFNLACDYWICDQFIVPNENLGDYNRTNLPFYYVVLTVNNIFYGINYSFQVILMAIMVKLIYDNSTVSLFIVIPIFELIHASPFFIKHAITYFCNGYDQEGQTYWGIIAGIVLGTSQIFLNIFGILSIFLAKIGTISFSLVNEDQIMAKGIFFYSCLHTRSMDTFKLLKTIVKDRTLFKWVWLLGFQAFVLEFFRSSHIFVTMKIGTGDNKVIQSSEFVDYVKDDIQLTEVMEEGMQVLMCILCIFFLKKENFVKYTFLNLIILEVQLFLSIFALFAESSGLQIVLTCLFGLGHKFICIIYYVINLMIYEGQLRYLILLQIVTTVCQYLIQFVCFSLYLFFLPSSYGQMSMDQLNTCIIVLEVIIGVIYLGKFTVILSNYYKNASDTMIMNQNQLQAYENQAQNSSQGDFKENNSNILNSGINSSGSLQQDSFTPVKPLGKNTNFQQRNNGGSVFSISTFQTYQKVQGVSNNMSQLVGGMGQGMNYSQVVRNSIQLQQQFQISGDEFFQMYEKCYKEMEGSGEIKEDILGKGSSATVYKYRIRRSKSQNSSTISSKHSNNSYNSLGNSNSIPTHNNKIDSNNNSLTFSHIPGDVEFVAVKITQGVSESDYENCLSEVNTIIKIQQYPHIISIYNYTILQQISSFQIFVAMDLAEKSLAQEIKQRKTKEKNKREYFSNEFMMQMSKELISTLSELQQFENIAHRDLKPQNILKMKGSDSYKLADFGEAKKFTVDNILTDPTIRGTVKYLSPELRYNYDILTGDGGDLQDEGEDLKEWDSYKSDVFSLGLTLFEAASLEGIVNFNLAESKISQGIQNLKNLGRFSDIFIDLISKMLTWESSKRPTFPLLKEYLQRKNC